MPKRSFILTLTKSKIKDNVLLIFIVFLLLAYLDGVFTETGLIMGYYIGEKNPILDNLINALTLNKAILYRGYFITFGLFVGIASYYLDKEILKKHYLLVLAGFFMYLAINIFHVAVLFYV